MLRRLTALLLCLGLTLSVFPTMNVSAVQEQGETITTQSSAAATVENTTQNGEYYTSLEAAAAALRQQLKQRNTSIQICYQVAGNYQNQATTLMDEALKHTGVPTEGDYIYYQMKAYEASTSYYQKSGYTYITVSYYVQYHSTAEQEALVDAAVADLRIQLGLDVKGGYDAISTIYGWITKNVKYDHQNVNDTNCSTLYSAYGALINWKTACQGYAVLAYRLLLESGIDNRVIAGTGNGGAHGWNIVKLNGAYYNIDATWDATYAQAGAAYTYFLRDQAHFADHIRDDKFNTTAFHTAYPMATEDYEQPRYWTQGICGEHLTWGITNEGVLVISGSGDMYDFAYSDIPWLENQGSITKIIIEDGATSVGDYAFIYGNNVQSVILPDSLTRIGTYAFAGCTKLKEISIPGGVTILENNAFESCSALENVQLQEGLETIGSDAFYACTSLKQIQLPDTLTTLGEDAFSCTGLISIVIPNGVTKLDGTFTSCNNLRSVTLPENLEIIDSSTFQWCRSLKEIVIPYGVTQISTFAFYTCEGLEKVTFLGGAPSIDSSAFTNVTANCYYPAGVSSWNYGKQNYGGTLTWISYDLPDGILAQGSCGTNVTWKFTADGTLTIGGTGEMADFSDKNAPWYCLKDDISKVVVENGVTSIGAGAFVECSYLDSVTLPDSLQSIGNAAFGWCNYLYTLHIPKNLSYISGTAFAGCTGLNKFTVDSKSLYFSADASGVLYSKDGKTIMRVPATVRGTFEIPAGVTAIGDYAFAYCNKLTGVTIPATVTKIGDFAFFFASGLKDISLPAGLTVLGDGAFEYCESITTVTIPTGVKRIGSFTFHGCAALETVTLHDGIAQIGNNAFGYCAALTAVDLPANLEAIGENAFTGCTGFAQIMIPEKVTQLGSGAFSGCSRLTEVVLYGDAPTIGENCFQGVTANIYYDKNNTTWHAGITQQYGGTLTWVACTIEAMCTDGHSYGEWYYIEKPWCALEGTKRHDCDDCDAYETAVANATGHMYCLERVPASETTSGYSRYTCTDCGYSFIEFSDPNNLTYSDAVLLIRDAMTHRRKSVTVSYWSDTPGSKAAAEALYQAAIDHCGIGYLGDYLTGHPRSSARANGYTNKVQGDKYYVGAEYYFSYTTTFEIEQKVNSKVAAIMEELNLDGKTDYEKTKIIHDYICQNMVYYNDFKETCHTAYCGFLCGYGVCQAYALMTYRLLTEAGVNCRYIVGGTSRGLHAWNIVEIDGVYYNLDTTWGDNPGSNGPISYDYFLKAPENFDDHWRWEEWDTEEFHEKHPMATQDYIVNSGECGDSAQWTLFPDGTVIIDGDGKAARSLYLSRYENQIKRIIVKPGITELGEYIFSSLRNLESITFEGDMPVMGSLGIFTLLQDPVTVYYPVNNGTWAGSTLDDQLGALIWTGYIAIGKCESNQNWMLLENGTLLLTGSGDMTTSVGHFPWRLQYASQIKHVVIGEGITSIGEFAFGQCVNLLSVTIPSTVTHIGEMAFFECAKLSGVTLPNSVVSIGAAAFYKCESLTEILIPVGVKSIGNDAFWFCSALSRITFHGDAPSIANNAFGNVTADVFYPSDNETWTEGQLWYYGGYLNWCPYEGIQVTPLEDVIVGVGEKIDLQVVAAGDGLTYRWYMRRPDQAEFSLVGNTNTLNLTADMDLNGAQIYCIVSDAEGRTHKTSTITVTVRQRLMLDQPVEIQMTFGEEVLLLFTPDASCKFRFITDGADSIYGGICDENGFIIQYGQYNMGEFELSFLTQAGEDYLLRLYVMDYEATDSFSIWAEGVHGNVTITVLDEATCTKSGIEQHSCECGTVWTEVIKPQHDYVNGECRFCQKTQAVDSGECGDDIIWELLPDGTLMLCGSGAMTDFRDYDIPWKQYQDRITAISIDSNITTIGSYAFQNCVLVEEIVLPAAVQKIGMAAFYGCDGLTQITIPEAVTVIEGWTFYMCENLAQITLQGPVTQIGTCAFQMCSALETIDLPNTLQVIQDNAFSACTGLVTLTIPASVQEIGDYAFAWCWRIQTVDFMGGAPTMYEYTFYSVYATAYYPQEYASWTQQVMDMYDMTWEAKVHTHNYAQTVTTPPTCTDQGFTTHTCACGDSYRDSFVGSKGHSYTHTVTKPTCTQRGYTTHSCSCGDSYVDTYTKATGHSYNAENQCACGDVKLGVLTQPTTRTVVAGKTIKYTVKASGESLSYQWQSSTDGKTWKNCSSSSATKATFSFTSKTSHNGNYYRCVITDMQGNKVYTDSVRAYVLGVTTQPKTATVKAGATIKYTVKATGASVKYQWQSSSDGKTWKNCSSTSATKATFSFTSKTSHNGNYYRCKITDSAGNVVYSDTVRAYVLGVSTQPKTQKVKAGSTIKLTVKATGNGLKYQWQSSSNGKTWKNCSSTSATKATFSFTSKTSHDGNYYRCKVTDSAGNVVYSDTVRTYVLGITEQPVKKSVTKGKTAKFTVEATGASVKYQWQYSTDGGKTWKNCSSTSAKKAAFSFTTKATHNGYYYRCKVTDSAGNTAYTNKVKLTVK